MPIIDHAMRLITCKLVYYGPGRAGKTSNLSYLHASLPADQVGNFTSLATRRDRTLFFDYMPVELGEVGAYRVRFQLYTVPGTMHNRSLRELVLRDVDGVVFVVDSQRERLSDNLESLQDLHRNLVEHGISMRELPFVFQYNNRDWPADDILSAKALSDALNFRGAPEFSANAHTGDGVFETLRSIGVQVLQRIGANRAMDPHHGDAQHGDTHFGEAAA
ncbi:MAG: GTPase domain-containing protein [Gemmatimonadaceae bacterium]